ncbi:hypothetical protein [Telmatospirillum sp. J64-1]|uniref:hypothetical protein n=1 Tax=Telmatospirillum sp. J64-1 TaxID=2502183 RepID=UPI00115C7DAF|nr:hypothetical protein [Telmatospirillum sp. J64-1]
MAETLTSIARSIAATAQDAFQARLMCVEASLSHSLDPYRMVEIVDQVEEMTGWRVHTGALGYESQEVS